MAVKQKKAQVATVAQQVESYYGSPLEQAVVDMPKNQKAYCVASVIGAAGLGVDAFVQNVNRLGVCSKADGFLAEVTKANKAGTLIKAKPYCQAKHSHALRGTRANGDTERKHVPKTIAMMRGEFGKELVATFAKLGIVCSDAKLEKHLDKWEAANQ